jgi:non-heme chloroperoxidase
MARLQAGKVQLGWREWGGGDVTVVFIHGNLASKDWIELAAPLFPTGLRVIGLDWRGCGESDRPKANADYSNYSMQQHAEDMLAALDALDVRFCHLATHSTGGIIAARMLLMQPKRFGRTRPGHAAWHAVQCRAGRPFPFDDGEQGADTGGDGHGGVLAVCSG